MLFKDLLVLQRKNKTETWSNSDSSRNYSPENSEGKNYSVDDVSYRYNSHGFRCDEFTDSADVPVLFLGCSFTEGIGLPLQHCWPYFILDRIGHLPENIGKDIPFFSLALGGSGTDTEADALIQNIDLIKPKYIIYLLSSYYRRQFCLESTFLTPWLPNTTINYYPLYKDSLNRLYSVENYAMYESYRSLKLIDLAVEKYNTKVFLFEMEPPTPELRFTSDMFSNITFHSTSTDAQYYDAPSKFKMSMFPGVPFYARDNLHPGVRWQYETATHIWSTIKKQISPSTAKTRDPVNHPQLVTKPSIEAK